MKQNKISDFLMYVGEYGKMFTDKGRFNRSLLQWMRADRFIGKIDTAKELSFLVKHNKFSDWSDETFKGLLGYGWGRGRGLGFKDEMKEMS